MWANVFAFGSCRMNYLPCPRCVTLTTSLPQVLFWLDVIAGVRRPPDEKLRPWVCHEQAAGEPWHYDLDQACVVVEVSTPKTAWCRGYPLSLYADWTQCRADARPPQLVVADADGLYADLVRLRERLPGRFLVLVCQQSASSDAMPLYYATAETRHLVRDVVFAAARSMKGVAAYDPTPRAEELGADRCLRDPHHWLPFGGRHFASDIFQLIPREMRR